MIFILHRNPKIAGFVPGTGYYNTIVEKVLSVFLLNTILSINLPINKMG
jgi:hypothetical protein